VTKIEAPRGTHDVLPSDQPLWQKVTGEMERLCALYGYRRIQTPVFEDTELFARTSGAGSDIVQKEMYTFEDRSGRSLTLRPEGTAPICRAYIEHGMKQEPQPVKLYTLATMYRYAAPQRGRFREHHQLSLECIGSADPAVDAEVIQFYDTLLRNLGVTRYELRLNSIGDRNCRPQYVEALNAWLDAHPEALDDEARQKRATSPLRVFDVKDEKVRAALQDAPKIGDSLCDECRAHFDAVKAHLDAYGIRYTIDPALVRGLDYYTRTTFEFAAEALDAAQNGVGGGGRYDGLVELLGGDPTPGIGFGIGIERVLLACDAEGVFSTSSVVAARPLQAYVIDIAGGETAVELTAELRRAGLRADRAFGGRSMKSQIKSADRSGALVALIVGEQEVAEETVVLRPLRDGEGQRTVSRAAAVDELKSFLANAAFAERSDDDVDRHLHPHLRDADADADVDVDPDTGIE
jgi:histidyl-tRNA synthetase